MKTVLELIRLAGGWRPGLHLKIDNPPYMELVIEAMEEPGPCGFPALSVCRYIEINGDLMRDPEMCFEVGNTGGEYLWVFYYRNDFLGVEQWSRAIRDGSYYFHPQRFQRHEQMAQLWDKALKHQRFAQAFDPAKHVRS
jgi:hypothetical protein